MNNRKQLLQVSNMSAFTFYLDDMTKLAVLKKQRHSGITQDKGSLSATIRVLLNLYAADKLDTLITNAMIDEEVLLTTKKNKRSSL